MTNDAPYQGHIMIEYRAVCPYHQIKSEIHLSKANAALAACDTRSFCPMCQEEAMQVIVETNGTVNRR